MHMVRVEGILTLVAASSYHCLVCFCVQMYAGAKCTGEVFNTGAAAPTMPPNFPVSSFKICRSSARK